MNKKYLILILCFIFISAATSQATDQEAASCSYANVNTAISDCISTGGGLVTIPACSTTAWGGDGVSISTDVPLRILGAGKQGAGGTNFSHTGNYLFLISGDGVTEIGQFADDGLSSGHTTVKLDDTDKATDTLIHDIKSVNMSASSFMVCQSLTNPVIMYNLDVRSNQTYAIYVYGTVDFTFAIPEPNWGINLTGGYTVIEDSYFYEMGGHVAGCFGGSKLVFRENTIDGQLDTAAVDGHAWGYGQSCNESNTDPRYHLNNYGAYQFEVHDNTWENTVATYCIRPRSGTGMVTDNICDANETIRLVVEATFGSGGSKDASVPDEVTGTDTNVYTAIEPHIAAAANRPITGGSWATYWKLAGSTGGTWTVDETYYPFLSAQSDCRVSVDIFDEFNDVFGEYTSYNDGYGDPEIWWINCKSAGDPYGACCTGDRQFSTEGVVDCDKIGKLKKPPAAYNIPHQWWIWGNTSAGTLYAEEDEPGCITENDNYWLRAPQGGDPVTSYTKMTYPHPLRGEAAATPTTSGVSIQ